MTLAAIESLNTAGGFELIESTRHGVAASLLDELASSLGVDRRSVANVLHISERTLSRRLQQKSRLTPEESDRAIRLARVFAKAKDTFGQQSKAAHWFQSPNRALGGSTPFELMDTGGGAEWVLTILGRIDYGVYS